MNIVQKNCPRFGKGKKKITVHPFTGVLGLV